MKTIPIHDLEEQDALDCFICHTGGTVLHRPGEPLTGEHIILMDRCGIENIVVLALDDDAQRFEREAKRKTVSIADIRPGEESPAVLYVGTKPVIQEGEPIGKDILIALYKKGIKELSYEKDEQESGHLQVVKYTSLLEHEVHTTLNQLGDVEHPRERKRRERELKEHEQKHKQQSTAQAFLHVPFPEKVLLLNPSADISVGNLKERFKTPSSMRRKPSGETLIDSFHCQLEQRPEQTIKQRLEQYHSWIEKLQSIMGTLKANRQVDFSELDSLSRSVVKALVEDRFFTCNLTNLRPDHTNELHSAAHGVNTGILSALISAAMGFTGIEIVECAMAGLLHDVGHVTTSRMLFAKKSLDSTDQQKYDQHAPNGVALLKNTSRIPLSTVFAVYQHHEKLDGSGRILHCTEPHIHDMAKIVAVAHIFDRKSRILGPGKAVAAILNYAKTKKVDAAAVKALCTALSLYPIGTFVLGNENTVGKVVGVNPKNIKQPPIRVMFTLQNNSLVPSDDRRLLNAPGCDDAAIGKELFIPRLTSMITQGF